MNGGKAQALSMAGDTGTAAQAAAEAGCEIDPITRSAIPRGADSGGAARAGHAGPVAAFIDPRLLQIREIRAAAGMARRVSAVEPRRLRQNSFCASY